MNCRNPEFYASGILKALPLKQEVIPFQGGMPPNAYEVYHVCFEVEDQDMTKNDQDILERYIGPAGRALADILNEYFEHDCLMFDPSPADHENSSGGSSFCTVTQDNKTVDAEIKYESLLKALLVTIRIKVAPVNKVPA